MKPLLKELDGKDIKELFPVLRNDWSVVLTGASLDVLARIHSVFDRLEVMGDDNRRSLWFWFSDGNRGRRWLKLVTMRYDGYVSLIIITDERYHHTVLMNSGQCGRMDSEWNGLLLPSLKALADYLESLVDWICADPVGYNAYVERYLPYFQRSGDIPRKTFNAIIPGKVEDAEYLRAGLERLAAAAPTVYDGLTLRGYVHVWCACFRELTRLRVEPSSYPTEYDREAFDDAGTMSDEDLFRRYNHKGVKISEYDLDTPDGYKGWSVYSPFHCLDVSYARIHLQPVELDGRTVLSLGFGVFGFWEEVAHIAVALMGRGIFLHLGKMNVLLGILNETDMVGFRPYPDKYVCHDGVTNQYCLPHIGSVTRKQWYQLVKNTVWRKQPKVVPAAGNEGGTE